MSYDSRIDDAVRRLQSQLGLDPKHIDGAWGGTSQEALLASGMYVDYDWEKVRSFLGGKITPEQFKGFVAIREAINSYGKDAINPLYFSYMLATSYHEVAGTMQPIEEIGKGRNRKYGKKFDITGAIYKFLNHIYYGRGYVQLTWLTNYVKMKESLGVDFVNNPELALVPKHAADIMITGMLKGMFTGLSLSRCIRYGSYAEFVYARRIINGTDKDGLIAGYAVNFLECLIIVDA